MRRRKARSRGASAPRQGQHVGFAFGDGVKTRGPALSTVGSNPVQKGQNDPDRQGWVSSAPRYGCAGGVTRWFAGQPRGTLEVGTTMLQSDDQP